MTEAVIVAIGRSPICRAMKGSLIDVRPDDLGAIVVRGVLEQVPELSTREIEDLLCGCAMPGGEQSHNLARTISLLSHLNVPGTTVNRYCASSLQTTRMATHAIRAGEGDVFLSVGVESSTRSPLGVFCDQIETQNPKLQGGFGEGLPNAYMMMGLTAENVADRCGITRKEMDAFAMQSQNRAVAAQADGSFDAEIVPVPLPNGTIMRLDDCPRPGTTTEVLGALRAAFRVDGRITSGNAQRRRRGGRGHVGPAGQGAWHQTHRPDRDHRLTALERHCQLERHCPTPAGRGARDNSAVSRQCANHAAVPLRLSLVRRAVPCHPHRGSRRRPAGAVCPPRFKGVGGENT